MSSMSHWVAGGGKDPYVDFSGYSYKYLTYEYSKASIKKAVDHLVKLSKVSRSYLRLSIIEPNDSAKVSYSAIVTGAYGRTSVKTITDHSSHYYSFNMAEQREYNSNWRERLVRFVMDIAHLKDFDVFVKDGFVYLYYLAKFTSQYQFYQYALIRSLPDETNPFIVKLCKYYSGITLGHVSSAFDQFVVVNNAERRYKNCNCEPIWIT